MRAIGPLGNRPAKLPPNRGLSTSAMRGLIRAYRTLVSPLIGNNCRFEPSCSRYAEQSLARHGFGHGSWLVMLRLLRCHPWNPGGYDPVP